MPIELTTRPLTEETWPAYADLIERHKGVWGGCWCLGFHEKLPVKGRGYEGNKQEKYRRVCENQTHAGLVFEGDRAVGWCQFGPIAELPIIHFRKAYESEPSHDPDWRITCFFVDKEYRGRGVASKALAEALVQIAKLGGGLVESFPEDAAGRKTGDAFLFNATLSIFERAGFERRRLLSKRHWLVTKLVQPRG